MEKLEWYPRNRFQCFFNCTNLTFNKQCAIGGSSCLVVQWSAFYLDDLSSNTAGCLKYIIEFFLAIGKKIAYMCYQHVVI